jgi:hypothetical protein
MEKEEIITQVANDILNTLNIGQIVNIAREHSVKRALEYYENLTEEERAELEKRILAAKAELEAKQKEEVEVAETEVVS